MKREARFADFLRNPVNRLMALSALMIVFAALGKALVSSSGFPPALAVLWIVGALSLLALFACALWNTVRDYVLKR